MINFSKNLYNLSEIEKKVHIKRSKEIIFENNVNKSSFIKNFDAKIFSAVINDKLFALTTTDKNYLINR